MDPLTVLKIAGTAASTAKAAWDVGEGLYSFCSDVKIINQTVNDMIAEVKALSSACTLVDERLRDIVNDFDSEIRRPRADRRKLWSCVEVQVIDSKLSVAQLETALEGIKKERSNTFAQAWRQIKLNMKARDISEARNRIRSHTASLQTILQTVAIEICYLVPQRADQQLQSLLGGMKDCLEQLKTLREERQQPSTKDEQTSVIQICEEVASQGESLYAASVASGSLWGDSNEATSKVRDWMNDIRAIDEVVSRSMPEDDGLDSIQGFSDDTTAHEDHSDVGTATRQAHPETSYADDADSDDEFLVEIAKEALDVARTCFEAKDYGEATSYLQESLKMVRELPAKRQRICDTFELRYMLSVCAFHTQAPSEAEADLLSFLDISSRTDEAKTDEQMRQVCEAGHLLAQTNVRLGKLEQARLYCDNALQGRRRLLGKNSNETCSSIALMARILTLQGKAYRAKVYMRLIPETERNAVEGTFDDIAPESPTEQATPPEFARPSSQHDTKTSKPILDMRLLDTPWTDTETARWSVANSDAEHDLPPYRDVDESPWTRGHEEDVRLDESYEAWRAHNAEDSKQQRDERKTYPQETLSSTDPPRTEYSLTDIEKLSSLTTGISSIAHGDEMAHNPDPWQSAIDLHTDCGTISIAVMKSDRIHLAQTRAKAWSKLLAATTQGDFNSSRLLTGTPSGDLVWKSVLRPRYEVKLYWDGTTGCVDVVDDDDERLCAFVLVVQGGEVVSQVWSQVAMRGKAKRFWQRLRKGEEEQSVGVYEAVVRGLTWEEGKEVDDWCRRG